MLTSREIWKLMARPGPEEDSSDLPPAEEPRGKEEHEDTGFQPTAPQGSENEQLNEQGAREQAPFAFGRF